MLLIELISLLVDRLITRIILTIRRNKLLSDLRRCIPMQTFDRHPNSHGTGFLLQLEIRSSLAPSL